MTASFVPFAGQPSLSGVPVLQTDRLILRGPQAGDWPHFDAMLQSDRGQHLRVGGYDRSMTWRNFNHLIGHWVTRGFGMFVWQAKGDETPLGMAGPWFPETWPEREIGWSVWNPSAEGKGLAFEAATAARRFAYDILGWLTAVSYIAPDNDRSARLALRLGAVLDPDAPSMGTPPVRVFRHPRPEALA